MISRHCKIAHLSLDNGQRKKSFKFLIFIFHQILKKRKTLFCIQNEHTKLIKRVTSKGGLD